PDGANVRGETPIPCRSLLPNEKLVKLPMEKNLIVRTDMPSEFNVPTILDGSGEGFAQLHPEVMEMLQRIDFHTWQIFNAGPLGGDDQED
ncbi:hypothetical protein LCGC14_2947150, partial [marine sediment metagenome]